MTTTDSTDSPRIRVLDVLLMQTPAVPARAAAPFFRQGQQGGGKHAEGRVRKPQLKRPHVPVGASSARQRRMEQSA